MDAPSTFEYEVVDHVATLRLSDTLSSWESNSSPGGDLLEVLRRINADSEIRVVVIAITSPRTSVYGASPLADQKRSEVEPGQFFETVFGEIFTASKIYLCSVSGNVQGLGAALVHVCDLATMGNSASISLPYAELGALNNRSVVGQVVRNVGYKQALEIFLENETLEARECLNSGLVNRLIPEKYLEPKTQAWAKSLSNFKTHQAQQIKLLAQDILSDSTIKPETIPDSTHLSPIESDRHSGSSCHPQSLQLNLRYKSTEEMLRHLAIEY